MYAEINEEMFEERGEAAAAGGGGMHIDDYDTAADIAADNDNVIVYCHKCGLIEDSLKRACINKRCKLNTSNTHHHNLRQNRGLLPQMTLPNAAPLGVNGSLNFKVLGNPSVIALAIVGEISSKKIADVQGFIAETKTDNTQKKVAVQIRPAMGQKRAFNDTANGLVVTQAICG